MFKKNKDHNSTSNSDNNFDGFVIDLKKQDCSDNWKKSFNEKVKQGAEVKKVYQKHEKTLDQLAFFFLFRFVFKFLGKITKLIFKIINKIFLSICYALSVLLRKLGKTSKYIVMSFISNLKTIRLKPKAAKIKKQKHKIISAKADEQIVPLTHAALMQYAELEKDNNKNEAIKQEITELKNSARTKKQAAPRSRFKPAFTFALILFIAVLPFKAVTYLSSMDFSNLKGRVLGITENAIGEFTQAGSSIMDMQFSQASQSFSDAGNNFLAAQKELGEINDLLFLLASIAPDKEIRLVADAGHVLKAGQLASSLGSELALAMNNLFNSDADLITTLNNFSIHGGKAEELIAALNQELISINASNLPDEYINQFIYIKEKANYLNQSLSQFIDIIEKIKIFIGESQEKRYLLIFQNNTEIRASGGFIGSYALVDMRDGGIKNIEAPKGGSYDTEAGLYEQVVSPEPLHLVNPLWHFWDANWWPDWEKSAKKLAWFYEKSDGSTVDGVISFTPTVIEKLLSVIGPIDMTEEYGIIIDADNFWLETQKIVEAKPAASPAEDEPGDEIGSNGLDAVESGQINNQPKKIIGDLMNKIIEELPERLSKDNLIKLIASLEESLSQRQLLFYFTDNVLEQKIKDLGWGGKIKQTNWDYLMVVNTNIAGGKSDKKIRQTISHSAEVLEDGTIIDTVEIKREHTAVKNELFAGVRNVNWIRVYVPIGSELIAASGFEQPDKIYFEDPAAAWQEDGDLFTENHQSSVHYPSMTKVYEESLKTVFANWTMVDPGQTDIITLKYKLPFKLEKSKQSFKLIDQIADLLNPEQELLYPYSLYIQKQPGMVNSSINSVLKLPENFEIAWNYPNELSVNPGGWVVKDSQMVDKYWAVLLEK